MRDTDKEINDAIAVVQQALKDKRVQYRLRSYEWIVAGNVNENAIYRAKPDPVEGWVSRHHIHMYQDECELDGCVYVKQADPEGTDEG